MARKKYIEQVVNIEQTEFPNYGIGYFEGNKVYIKNTITGQKVKTLIKKKKQKYEGRLLEILEKADYEISPDCEYSGICGGCTYQNITYDKELEIKKTNVLNILKNENIEDFEFLGINKSPNIDCYRNKMEFSFGDTGKDGELCLGVRKRNSYYEVINASNCKIVSEDIRKIVKCVLDYFKNTNETFYNRMKKTGTLRHLIVRQAFFTKEIIIGLVTSSQFNIDLTMLKENLLNLNLDGEIKGFLHLLNDSNADVVKADNINIIYGNDYFYEKLLGLDFKISLFSFFQTNSAGAEKLYSIVKKFVGAVDNQTVFDLYCGTGTIAQIVAKDANKVMGVELVEEAVEAAKINASLNGIKNCEFIAGDVYKVVSELNINPDLIILDPPREGINPKAIEKIVEFDANRIIYISCKASSLAKDLKIFIENGYKIDKLEMMDMFPRTYHIETIVLLYKLK
ncbi:23S rRNA (uracil(1939)-C(5))-methyltransferase RlmD [[Clostridium] colinum]|uniref:23S rRNA (uracil(1939)-C(5))-methyltransferase RlmD n=1 Tax=[Clostridium] colinum TaxID=36835 RepID=UPI002024F997|nr:23S rRNA (uracil(1939)-C(5))-methyltransferase RlmD [[Clostridium] colinum]